MLGGAGRAYSADAPREVNARIASISERLEAATNRVSRCAELVGGANASIFGQEPETANARTAEMVGGPNVPVEVNLNVLFTTIDELERQVGKLTS